MLNENVSAKAGKPATSEMLVDVARLEREYFERPPDIEDPNQLVGFGTSGHRGSSLRGSINEAHILAITQAICDYRQTQRTKGARYMDMDTHALSYLAQRTGLEVLAANQIESVSNGITASPRRLPSPEEFFHTTGNENGILRTPLWLSLPQSTG